MWGIRGLQGPDPNPNPNHNLSPRPNSRDLVESEQDRVKVRVKVRVNVRVSVKVRVRIRVRFRVKVRARTILSQVRSASRDGPLRDVQVLYLGVLQLRPCSVILMFKKRLNTETEYVAYQG